MADSQSIYPLDSSLPLAARLAPGGWQVRLVMFPGGAR